MEKLELKHLAPYSPYELKLYSDGVSFTLGNYSAPGYITVGYALREGYKLLLRPLSDLTKEIEVNGEPFITSMIFSSHELEIMENNKLIGDEPMWGIPYQKVQQLLELHFDVFNLIPNGLAIDISTLETAKL